MDDYGILSGKAVDILRDTDVPNEFFRKQISKHKPGKLLLPVYNMQDAAFAKNLGWQVCGLNAHKQVAQTHMQNKTVVEDQQRMLENNINWTLLKSSEYDMVVFNLCQCGKEYKIAWFEKVLYALKPGTKVLFEGFSIDQMRLNRSAACDNQMFFTEETILEIFHSLSKLKVWSDNISGIPDLQGVVSCVVRMTGVR